MPIPYFALHFHSVSGNVNLQLSRTFIFDPKVLKQKYRLMTLLLTAKGKDHIRQIVVFLVVFHLSLYNGTTLISGPFK